MSFDNTEATTATATAESSLSASSRRRTLADRVTFSSIDKNRIGSVRVLNSTLFPVKYKEQFYRDILLPEVEEFCKLVYEDNIPVGTICCRFETKDDETKLYLMTMGILAPYRSRGLGSRTLQLVIDAARAHEKPRIAAIYLHVQVSNTEARRFYERHNFVETSRAENYYKQIQPRDAWVLELRLHPEDKLDPSATADKAAADDRVDAQ